MRLRMSVIKSPVIRSGLGVELKASNSTDFVLRHKTHSRRFRDENKPEMLRVKNSWRLPLKVDCLASRDVTVASRLFAAKMI